jgi:hypothetical protein
MYRIANLLRHEGTKLKNKETSEKSFHLSEASLEPTVLIDAQAGTVAGTANQDKIRLTLGWRCPKMMLDHT